MSKEITLMLPRFVGLILLSLTLPLLAMADPGPEEADNKSQFRRDTQAFMVLPPERRDQILQLDEDLFNLPAANRGRLLHVADNYRKWFDRLDEKDRQRIKDAPDRHARLALIESLREQDWLRFQPKAHRDKLEALEGMERAAFLKKIRLEDHQRHQSWLIAARFWPDLTSGKFTPPIRLADLPPNLQEYVNEYLKPMLNKEEKDRLLKAEESWPMFPQTLVELADRHPPALPGPEGPKNFGELPPAVQQKIKASKINLKDLKLKEGEWPGYAIHLFRMASKKGVPLLFPHEFWPTSKNALSPPMQEFYGKLVSMLTPQETRDLGDTLGLWPDFPQVIQKLADKYKLQPPWFTLPAHPREHWENYRLPKLAPENPPES